MADVTGLVFGAIALAGLFTSCIDLVDAIETGRSLGVDHILLKTRYANQRFRLAAEGKRWGFSSYNSEGRGYDPRLDSVELRPRLEETLLCIKLLLEDGTRLADKYGLVPAKTTDLTALNGTAAGTSVGRSAYRFLAFSRQITRTQRAAGLQSTAEWIVRDKGKFSELMVHLNAFLDDLDRLTQDLHLAEWLRCSMKGEMQSTLRSPALKNIEAAQAEAASSCSVTGADAVNVSHAAGEMSSWTEYSDIGLREAALEITTRSSANGTSSKWATTLTIVMLPISLMASFYGSSLT